MDLKENEDRNITLGDSQILKMKVKAESVKTPRIWFGQVQKNAFTPKNKFSKYTWRGVVASFNMVFIC